jgi:hypothetical protein
MRVRSVSTRCRLFWSLTVAATVALLFSAAAVAAPPPSLVLQSFTAETTGPGATLAGAHPDLVVTYLLEPDPALPSRPSGEVKEAVSDLPPGFVGDPTAVPACEEWVMGSGKCAPDSQVGVITLYVGFGEKPVFIVPVELPVYNLVPSHGHAAELGWNILGPANALGYASVEPGTGYGLRLTLPNIPTALSIGPIFGAQLHLWGVPAESSHDPERFVGFFSQGHPSTAPLRPFLTNPVACDGSQPEVKISMDSWQDPAKFVPATALLPAITGCDALAFDPSISVQPTIATAGEPTGLQVGLKIPQNDEPNARATGRLHRAIVTLPAGMSLSPSAGDGLEACSDVAFAVSSTAPAGCPSASQIGTVKVVTPLLSNPLEGELFIGEPLCGNTAHPAPCDAKYAEEGKLFRLFLQARGSGVTIKLPGTLSVNPSTGQVTTRFLENPQLPFSELKLNVDGGPRAPLANPSTCGIFTATSDLTPWSSPFTPDATPSGEFEVTGCAAPRFAPSFTAGTTNNQAGAFSPFTVTLSRTDQDQSLGTITTQMPPGVSGMLSKVPLCGEAEANAGTCPAASLIGHTTVGVGAGSNPLYLGGSVFLTGPYRGAPFGLSIVVPAKAGPFNLGTEVVRAAIRIDPRTAAVTIASAPLPRILDGVPLQIRTVNVTVDRPGFMFNPTDCSPLSVGGTITSTQGATANVSSRFQAANCATLPFKPSLQVSTSAKTSRKNGASLHVVVRSGAGQANIHSVHVTLPKIMPSRLPTLQQACIDTVFNENPAKCPAGSKVGGAVAHTPVLAKPLSGPMYFVSHGGAAFPDLVAVLQGEGVTVELVGQTAIKNNVTSSTFASVPDVPIVRFDMTLPQGTHSVLTAIGSLCKQRAKLTMPTTIRGQNGAVVKQTTKIAVGGCPKPKKRK